MKKESRVRVSKNGELRIPAAPPARQWGTFAGEESQNYCTFLA